MLLTKNVKYCKRLRRKCIAERKNQKNKYETPKCNTYLNACLR